MIESLFFLSGVATTLIVIFLVYIIWKKKVENMIGSVKDSIFAPSVKMIDEANVSIDHLKNSANDIEKVMKSFNQQLKYLPSDLEKISTCSEEISKTIEALQSIMKNFQSFADTVRKIQESGVEILTKGAKHPDLHEKIVLLFSKEGEKTKIIDWIKKLLINGGKR